MRLLPFELRPGSAPLPPPTMNRAGGAYFAEGRDIGPIGVLLDLAVEVGLERIGVEVELDIDQYADAVAQAQ